MPFTPRFTLLPIAVALVGYWLLLRHTLVSGHWLLPAMLAASVALLVLALNLVWSAARRREQFTTSAPSTWRDGQAVAFEARLQAGSVPLQAPASGEDCALYTWQMQRQDNGRVKAYGQGVALANATVIGPGGAIRLYGLPAVVGLPEEIISDVPRLTRFARHLLGGAVELPDDLSPAGGLMPTSFSAAQLHAIEARLGDPSEAGGALRFEFARPRETSLDHRFGDAVLPWAEARAEVLAGAVEAGAARFAKAMRSRLCVSVREGRLPAGAPVCVFGTWKAASQHVLIDAREDPSTRRLAGTTVVDGLQHASNNRRFRIVGQSMDDWIRLGRRVAATLLVLSVMPLLAAHYLAWRWLAPGFSATPYPLGVLTPGELRRWRDGDVDVVAQVLGTLGATRGHSTPSDEERLHVLRGLLAYRVDLSRPRVLSALQSVRLGELQLLLDHGADPNATGFFGSSTALHAAAWSADAARIALLLRAGADPARKDSQGFTPLQLLQARVADPDAALDPVQSQRAIDLLSGAAAPP